MTNVTYEVPNISCGHCVATIERAVRELDGVTDVAAHVESKRVDVTFAAPATEEAIVAALTQWGYPPQQG